MKILWKLIFSALLGYGCQGQEFSYCTHPDDLWTVWPDWNNASNFVTCYWNEPGRYRFNPCPYPLLFAFHLQHCTYDINWKPPPPPEEITRFPTPPTPGITESTTQGIGTTSVDPIETTTQGIGTTSVDPIETTTQGIGTEPTYPITDPPPGLDACFRQRDLFDGDQYLKTVCLVTLMTNYDTARSSCAAMGMNLFIIENNVVQKQLFNFSTEIITIWPGAHAWINGRYNEIFDIWTVQNAEDDQKGLLYEGVDWVDTDFIEGRTNGPCLRYTSEFGDFQAMGMDCDVRSIFLCEHFFPYETATTTEEPTEPPPEPACFVQRDLYDGENYLKSMCFATLITNYDTARAACRLIDMNLFIIDSDVTQTAFFNATTEILSFWNGGHVWINGRYNQFWDVWTVQNSLDNQIGLLYSGMDFYAETFDGRTSGPCLRYSSEFGHFQGIGIDCRARSMVICEFSKESSPMPPLTSTEPPTESTSVSTETTTLPLPTGPPNLDQCDFQQDIYNDVEYLKTMCIVANPSSYGAARMSCAEANMNLFVIDTEVIHRLFFNTTSNLIPTQGINMWINGRTLEFPVVWTVRNPDDTLRGLLYNGMDWVQTEDIDGRLNGPCLRYTSEFGHYQGIGMDCTMSSWFVCEHFQQQTNPITTTTNTDDTTTTFEQITTTTQGLNTDPPITQTTTTNDNGLPINTDPITISPKTTSNEPIPEEDLKLDDSIADEAEQIFRIEDKLRRKLEKALKHFKLF